MSWQEVGMFKKAVLMWIYAEHPVHAGSGSGVGAIDLPIQRERVTNWPIIQPSGIKGALREYFEKLCKGTLGDHAERDAELKRKVDEVFGPDQEATHSGAASFTEAKVLFFPIRSLRGTFAYVTCPLALERFHRDLDTLRMCGGANLADPGNGPKFPALSGVSPDMDTVWIAAKDKDAAKSDSVLIAGTGDGHVVFEELSFKARASKEVSQLAKWLLHAAKSLPWLDQKHLGRRLAIVSDDIFKDFVEMSTEVVTRNRIDDSTGTVQEGALWIEERLPRETVLYSLIFAADPFVKKPQLAGSEAVLNFLRQEKHAPQYLWIGGNTTVGQGLVRLAFV